jgi:putative nucleotidyltransferase with HDIG domain
LLEEYEVPPHIIRHSEMVCKVAVLLGEQLNRHGANLNIPEITGAALLHDITKMESMETGHNHATTGKDLLAKRGFGRIGQIIAEHIKLREGRSSLPLSEEEIINYSDKRVMHTHIVSLGERFADLRKRYGTKNPDEAVHKRIADLERETFKLERKIFSSLDFGPEDVPVLLEAGDTIIGKRSWEKGER